MTSTDNLRIARTRSLVAPITLAEEIPLHEDAAGFIQQSRQTISDIVHRQDNRLLVIVGPCSVHDLIAVHEYAGKLKALSERLQDKLFIVMRGDVTWPVRTV